MVLGELVSCMNLGLRGWEGWDFWLEKELKVLSVSEIGSTTPKLLKRGKLRANSMMKLAVRSLSCRGGYPTTAWGDSEYGQEDQP